MCGNAASTDLYGGCLLRGIPTVTAAVPVESGTIDLPGLTGLLSETSRGFIEVLSSRGRKILLTLRDGGSPLLGVNPEKAF